MPAKFSTRASRKTEGGAAPLTEKVAGAMGGLLFAAMIGVTIYQAVAGDRSPAAIVVTAEGITASGSGFLVAFRAENRGGLAAQAVVVEGRVMEGGAERDSAQVTLDFVAPGSAKRGRLWLAVDPRCCELRLLARGHQQP